jgi:murein peptide amidase A
VSEDIITTIYDELALAWRSLRTGHGLRLREVACVGAARTLLLAEGGDPALPVVALSAGVHGDEPVGPWALHAVVRDRLLDPRFSYRIWPCLNPTGFAAGTRENAEGVDVNRTFGRGGHSPEAKAVLTANRDRRFALTIDLHEDHEAGGFYLYETLPSGTLSRFAAPLAAGLADAGFPLQDIDEAFDLGPPGCEAAQVRGHGSVIVDADRERRFFEPGLPLGLVMVRRATPRALTFETPRARPFEERIAMQRLAIVIALAVLAGEER